MIKWIIKLVEFDIQYHPCPSMKTQVLADLVAECTIPDNNPEVESNDKIKSVEIFKLESISVWVLHIDGASNA